MSAIVLYSLKHFNHRPGYIFEHTLNQFSGKILLSVDKYLQYTFNLSKERKKEKITEKYSCQKKTRENTACVLDRNFISTAEPQPGFLELRLVQKNFTKTRCVDGALLRPAASHRGFLELRLAVSL